ncbi:hypothetical protein BJX63DRAFT_407198 [Aspergillus granulosus]|uniref:F-box domain-containing protein n=1 Tax=Aspergillus granulosus TaxID=176169 RepID=A0ABR4H0M5_9EURO
MVHEPYLARSKSPLESLPTEIIQEIFLRCLEVNLPRASLHVARALSDPVIYSWLIRLAFSVAKPGGDDEEDEDERAPFITRHFLPPYAIVGYIEPAEMVALRTQILGCRWCTLPAIRDCQVKFLSHVSRYIRQDIQIFPDDCHLFNHTRIEREFENINAQRMAVDGKLGTADVTLRANKLFKPPTSGPDFRVGIWFNLGLVTISLREGLDFSGNRYFELPSCEDTYLPRKLLGPPWTETKLEFFQLLSTKAILDRDETYARATRTIQRVIRDRDFPTFMRLLDFWIRVAEHKDPVRFPTRNPVFKAALKYAEGYDDPFVRVLVEDRWTHIDPDDLRLKERLLAAVSIDYPPPNIITASGRNYYY